ncbi:MAG: MotA/TolQ/ExbB proton channel family protein [Bdellovibrionota bacterium]
MSSLPIGIFLTFFVFLFSMGLDTIGTYFNLHSVLIVGGGTIGILFFATPQAVLKNLFYELKTLGAKPLTMQDTKSEIEALTKNKEATFTSKDDLVSYAQLLWSQGVAQDLFVVLISQKKKEIEQRSVDAIQALKNLAKYPPSLGMAGTVMGIVTLFQALDGAKDKIGPGLAMAMTATFFGLIIANAIIMPISDRLQVKHMASTRYLQSIYQILLLINQDEAAELINEEVELRAS